MARVVDLREETLYCEDNIRTTMFTSPYKCPRCVNGSFLSTRSHFETEHITLDKKGRLKKWDNNIQHQSIFEGRLLSLKQFTVKNCHLEKQLQDLRNAQKIIKILRRGSQEIDPHQQSNVISSKKLSDSKRSLRKLLMMHNEVLIPASNTTHRYLSYTVDSLSHEVVKCRENQWKTADALYQSEGIMTGVERSEAGDKNEVKGFIVLDQSLNETEEKLEEATFKEEKKEGLPNQLQTSNRLSEKEKKVLRVNPPILPCTQEQVTDVIHIREEVPTVKKCEDTGTKIAQQTSTEKELQASQNVSSLNLYKVNIGAQEKEMDSTTLKIKAFKKINIKNSQLKFILKRSKKLEEDRQVLLLEMKNLLSKAGVDNQKLQNDLTLKENKLNHLNGALEKIKIGKGQLVSETFDLYKDAQNIIEYFEEKLRLKERELHQSKTRIESMNIAYENLLHDNRIAVAASEKLDNAYKRLLQYKDEDLNTAQRQLSAMKEKENQIHIETTELETKIRLSAEVQNHLRCEMKEIGDEQVKTTREFESVKSFLKNTKSKESLVRAELEKFISELVDRAESAENDLQQLKVQIETEELLQTSLQETEGEATRSLEELIAAIPKNEKKNTCKKYNTVFESVDVEGTDFYVDDNGIIWDESGMTLLDLDLRFSPSDIVTTYVESSDRDSSSNESRRKEHMKNFQHVRDKIFQYKLEREQNLAVSILKSKYLLDHGEIDIILST